MIKKIARLVLRKELASLKRSILRDAPALQVVTVPRDAVRLQSGEYDRLVNALPTMVVTSSTTAIEAGYYAGMQRVLHLLRTGFTTEV